jgi:esterase/lipase
MVQAEGDEAASPEAARNAFKAMASRDKTHRLFSDRSNHHLLWDYEAEEAKAVILEFIDRLEAEATAS